MLPYRRRVWLGGCIFLVERVLFEVEVELAFRGRKRTRRVVREANLAAEYRSCLLNRPADTTAALGLSLIHI